MIPVVTVAEMNAIDAEATEPVEVLIDRAGAAVAWAGRQMMGGTYGRRVTVVAGPGNNGADGRVAGERLRRWGARVTVIDATDPPAEIAPCSLVIDAAFGTGLSRAYRAPRVPPGVRVLAVDIPSGFDGDTGAVLGEPTGADRTVTFAAPTPGLLFEPCRSAAATVEIADIGLDVSRSTIGRVEDGDVRQWVPDRPVDHHKWRSAVAVVGGAPGTRGAAQLTATAALRAGAGYAQWWTPDDGEPSGTVDVVARSFSADQLRAEARRLRAIVVGPGLGLDRDAESALASVLDLELPVVVDADGLTLVARSPKLTGRRSAGTVLTPHDGEYERLAGHPPGDDRIAAARELAVAYRAIVLLKGPTTVVAAPDGRARVVSVGTADLAVAGSGDVLAGTIGALLARGADALDAAAAGAHVHALAGATAGATPLIASDLPARVGAVLRRVGVR